jgi:succinylglutamic semialdehyde dehydrogenase
VPHPSLLKIASADLFAGRWVPIPGDSLRSHNPAHPEEVIWQGTPVLAHVDQAVAAARAALPVWSRWPLERRAAVLRRFAKIATARVDEMTALIRDEVGKPAWDAKGEAALLAAKVDITLDQGPEGAMRRVTGYDTALSPTRRGRAWFRPHGVMAVLGPFNFPAHLPNGHIVPALALGNTIVFKPSDKTPACGQLLAEFYQEALEAEAAPPGVFNLVQGTAPIAAALASHADIDGVLFTGSWPVGRRILEANLDRPGRILALEMGGNNPAVILADADLKQAVIECVRCAFISSGQRCTCTRRLIVHEAVADRVIPAICKAASSLILGDPRDTQTPVFMGPVISQAAREQILASQAEMHAAGGRTLVLATAVDGPGGGWYVSPGVMQVDGFSWAGSGDRGGSGEGGETGRGMVAGEIASSTQSQLRAAPLSPSYSAISSLPGADVEVFGPFLRITTVKNLDEAIEQANATDFGLAASLFTKDPAAIERFQHEVRAGCININTGTAGASSKLPFGGLGHSGNHRPAGSFSVDYSAYPVAGMIEQADAALISPGMRFEDAWLH